MRSIKAKIALLVIAFTVAASAAIGIISFSNSNSLIKSNSRQIVNDSCQKTSFNMNDYLRRVEQSVDMLADLAMDSLGDIDEFRASDEYVDNYTASLAPAILAAAQNTDGAISAYIRYSPDLAYPTSGIFYMRSSPTAPYNIVENTDFSIYEKTDLNHVGWYYIPVNNGKPTWMDPYFNDNVNIYMISYVVPLFVNGENLGILGMDISFSQLEDLAVPNLIYDGGEVFITDPSNNILYHEGTELGTPLSALDGSGMTAICEDLSQNPNTFDRELLPRMTYNNTEYLTSFYTLRNNMKVITAVPYKNVMKSSTQLLITVIVLSVFIIVVSAAAAIVIASGIAQPIHALSTAARKIAEGDLAAKIDVKRNSKDEVGQLVRNFSFTVTKLNEYVEYIDEITSVLDGIASGELDFSLNMNYHGEFKKIKNALINISKTLNSTISEINTAAEQVSAGSQQISMGAASLAQSSAEQTSSIQELTDSIDELAEDIRKNNENIHKAFSEMEKNISDIDESSRDMLEMRTAMNDISEASEKIRNIVLTVDDIASQTNILALNAAIEAARAGEAGRGFAVVAGEIQLLASKTTKATTDINSLVDNVMQTVETGTNVFVKTDESIRNVSDAASEIKNSLQSISESSERQSDSIVNVNQNIRQINDVVQSNSATSEESAAASRQMNERADKLKEKIKIFKLKA